MRRRVCRGEVPTRPRVEDLWVFCDGDGAGALLLTLEFLAMRREEVADASALRLLDDEPCLGRPRVAA